MNATHKQMTKRWQDILSLCHEPQSVYAISRDLGLNGQFGLRTTCNDLIAIGYLEKIKTTRQNTQLSVLYKTIKPIYDTSNFDADMVIVRQKRAETVGKKPAPLPLEPHVRRVSVDDYHTRGNRSRAKVWAGVCEYLG